MTQEYVELMGGQRSKHFAKFRNSMVKGFLTLRDHSDELISFVEMTMVSGLDLPCFQGKERVVSELRDRLKLDLTKSEATKYMHEMIKSACDNWRTRWYDKF